MGHSLEVERASFLPVGDAQIIPGAKSLFTSKEIESSKLLEKTLFTDMLRYAKENGYTVNGGGVARLIRIFMDAQEIHHYLMEFWLPVL